MWFYDFTGKKPLKFIPGFPQDISYVPSPFTNVALYPFAVINNICKYNMLSPVNPLSKSLNLLVVLGTWHGAYFLQLLLLYLTIPFLSLHFSNPCLTNPYIKFPVLKKKSVIFMTGPWFTKPLSKDKLSS